MKVCVYGAGPIGCFIAARLFKGGGDVSLIARGTNLEAIRSNGISIHTPDYDIHAPVKVTDDPSSLGIQDIVIVAVKAPAQTNILAPLLGLLGPASKVVFLQNGIPWWFFHGFGGVLADRRMQALDPSDEMWQQIGPERAIGGVIFVGADSVSPGVIHVETAKPRLYLGTPSGEISPMLTELCATIRGDSLTTEAVIDIRKHILNKLQMNICSGLLGCLSNSAPKYAYADPPIAEAVRVLVGEIGAVATALGIDTGVDVEAMLARTRSQEHRSSIVQDLDNGRLMEFDAMFGAPRTLAQWTQTVAPMLDLLVALVKLRAQQAGAYTTS